MKTEKKNLQEKVTQRHTIRREHKKMLSVCIHTPHILLSIDWSLICIPTINISAS